MPTYAIGDLQGCLKPLLKLLDKIKFSDTSDKLWFLGDLVNRGPESLASLHFIKSLGDSATVVLGNHDLHLLAVAHGHKKANKKDTLSDILESPERDALLHWLQTRKLLHYDEKLNTIAVHAGIPPTWGLNKARKLAEEVESCLRGNKHAKYFADMYGNIPDTWNDKLKGTERLRVITNYFTRMRFCNEQSQLEFRTKTGPSDAPKGFAPWYSFANKNLKNTRIVFGHWASLNGQTGHSRIIGLDTGCVWGGKLTALRLEDGEKFSVNSDV